ncbi:MAG: hypothetical protein GY832_17945 [Chloroflexi bacterium]|nr:hypothetical protein [Chloroflexota bacterium]
MINKFENVWANTGTTAEPTDEKKDEGWVGGEQMPIDYQNFVQNLVETRINELADRINTGNDGSTNAVTQSSIATGLWTDPWGVTSDTDNVISAGATKELVDICAFFNSDGDPRLLVLDDANSKIEVWNPRTLASVIESNALTDDLPSGTWEAYSMCTDGTYAYCMFRDTAATPDEHHIQAWEISESDSNWAVHAGWAAVSTTGTALPGNGNGQETEMRDGQIIVASSTKLATLNHWTVVSATNSPTVSIIDITDGTIDASGAGDCGTSSSLQSCAKIASDGTNVYFVAQDIGTTNSFLCSATIADPTAGLGAPASYPHNLGTDYRGGLVTACGTRMVTAATEDETSGLSAASIVVWSHDSTDADLDYFTLGRDYQATPLEGDNSHYDEGCDSCFDGINVWILTVASISVTTPNLALIGLDVSKMSYVGTGYHRQLTDMCKGPFIIDPSVQAPPAAERKMCMCFDGRDIWVIVDPRASQTSSGKIFRLPQARFRG